MSVNITVHGSPLKRKRFQNVLFDQEKTRKEQNDERRKQRLQQVRLKSKEIASKLRENVNLEQKKQFKQIQQVKERELNEWQKKSLHNTENSQFGEAHRAAAIENKLNAQSKTYRKPKSPSQNPKTKNIFNVKAKITTLTKDSQPSSSQQSERMSPKKNSNSNKINKTIYSKNPNSILASPQRFKSKQTEILSPKPTKNSNVEIIFNPKKKSNSKSISSPSKSSKKKSVFKNTDKENYFQVSNVQKYTVGHLYPKVNIQKSSEKSLSSDEINSQLDKTKNLKKYKLDHTPIIKDSYSKSPRLEDTHQRVIQNICLHSKQCFCCMCNQLLKKKTCSHNKKDCPCEDILETSSSSSSSSSIESEKSKNQPSSSKTTKTYESKLTKTPSVILEIGSEDSDSSATSHCTNIEDSHSTSNRHFSRVCSKNNKKNSQTSVNYTVEEEQAIEISKPSSNSNLIARKRFSKISEFIKNQNNLDGKSIETSLDKSTQISTDNQQVTNTKISTDNPVVSFPKKNNLEKSTQQKIPIFRNLHQPQKSPGKKSNTQTSSKITTTTLTKPIGGKKTKVNSINNSDKTTSLSQPTNDKVEFYDYNNKFQKQYEPKLTNVIPSDHNIGHLTAMDNANIERQVEKSNEIALELLKKKSEERCKEAIEREEVRRDYEALQAKIDALTNAKQNSHSLNHSQEENIFSDVRLKQISQAQNNKINSAIENILQRPVVITCPEINNQQINQQGQFNLTENSTHLNVGKQFDNSNYLNSSDSCCSILFNYVDQQSEKIANEINHSDNNEKTKTLKLLLNRINSLKDLIQKEIKANETKSDKESIKHFMTSINELQKVHEIITEKCKDKKDLEKRENRLKKHEAILEKKLIEFYKMQNLLKKTPDSVNSLDGVKNSSNSSTDSSSLIEKQTISSNLTNKPIEIIIQVKNKTPRKSSIDKSSNGKSPRLRASLIDVMIKGKKKHNVQKISTPIRNKNSEEHLNSENTISTVYKSPPITIKNKIDQIINEKIQIQQDQIESITKNFPNSKKPITPKKIEKFETAEVKKSSKLFKVPDKITENLQTIKKSTSKSKNVDEKVQTKNLNPILGHYIDRLLGMSRHSINMLGVSSSDVTTPNSTIINTPGNLSVRDETYQKERIDRLQRFIEDNYSFLSELEESIKPDEKSKYVSPKNVGAIWKKSFKLNTKNINNESEERSTTPILKKTTLKKKKPTKLSNEHENENEISVNGDKLEVLGKYTELTNTCGQRIAELNEMISRVRQEKQKILEITLSSNGEIVSENGKNSTEYYDFVTKQQQQKEQQQSQSTGGRTYTAVEANQPNSSSSNNTKVSNPQILIDEDKSDRIVQTKQNTVPVPELEMPENIQLEKNKLTGISRDSGISLSRPVTALDSRESPDQNRDTTNMENVMNFELLLKDIPKPNSNNVLGHKTTPYCHIDKIHKKNNKPPVALSRFSPQLIEELPHELSTILEIDTPGTSRVNGMPKSNNQNDEQSYLSEHQSEIEINYQNFPTFEEYAKNFNLDTSHFGPEVNAKIQTEFYKLLEVSQQLNDYKEFPKITTETISKDNTNITIDSKHLTNSEESLNNAIDELAKIQIGLKKFPKPKEYFEKIGATDLIDSRSLSDMMEKTLGSSGDSLPDVNAELIRRKILKHSFDTYNNLNKNEEVNNDYVNSSSSSKTNKNKFSDNEMSGVEKLPLSAGTTTTTATATGQSKTSEMEKDFEAMGLKWANRMLQKTQESQALSSSTSSSFAFERASKKSSQLFIANEENNLFKSSTKNDFKLDLDQSGESSMCSQPGKPINLREFLASELQKLTHSSTASTDLSDSSIASLFLRSLIGTLSTSSSSSRKHTDNNNKQKTSTPVPPIRSSSSSKNKHLTTMSSQENSTDNSMKFFSNDSRLSSVRLSQSGGENDKKNVQKSSS